VAVARLEPFPEASVVVVVADALAAPPLPPLPEPLAPAPPVANAEFVESEGLFAIALASPPLPPSPTPSNDPEITGTITVSAIAGEIATSAMNAADRSSLAFISSSPDANSCYADHSPVGCALCRHSSTSALREGWERLCRLYKRHFRSVL
jgi:hypothetical protein